MCHTEEADKGGCLEVGPLVDKFNRLNCFFLLFVLIQKVTNLPTGILGRSRRIDASAHLSNIRKFPIVLIFNIGNSKFEVGYSFITLFF